MFAFMLHILIPVHILYIDWIWQGTDLSAILTSANYRLPIQHPSLAAISDNHQGTELKQRPKFWECPISGKKGSRGDLLLSQYLSKMEFGCNIKCYITFQKHRPVSSLKRLGKHSEIQLGPSLAACHCICWCHIPYVGEWNETGCINPLKTGH